MERVTAFWSAIALYTDGYSGDLVDVHRNLRGIGHQDFNRWLDLFRATLDETAPTPEAVNYLMVRATRVAQSLEMAVFERSADDVPILRARGSGDGCSQVRPFRHGSDCDTRRRSARPGRKETE